MSPALTPAVFLDRDGTLIEDSGYLADPAQVIPYPGTADALARLQAAGFKTVIVTNQSGIGRGYFTVEDFHCVQARVLEMLGVAHIDATYFCADHPDMASDRRKPAPGMLLEAARDLGLDLSRSWMIGDRTSDLAAGERAGCRSILVRTGEGTHANPTGATHVTRDFPSAVKLILNSEECVKFTSKKQTL